MMKEMTACLYADEPKERRGGQITQKGRSPLQRDLEEVTRDCGGAGCRHFIHAAHGVPCMSTDAGASLSLGKFSPIVSISLEK